MVSSEKLDELISRAYGTACSHGFHDVERSDVHWMMLIVSEIGEMVEADRKNRHADVASYRVGGLESAPTIFERWIKDTLEDELADVVIRICDFCGARRIKPIAVHSQMDDDWVNLWGEDTICEQCYGLVRIITHMGEDTTADEASLFLGAAIAWCFGFADFHGFDLLWHIEKKMEYNETRSLRHGKSY